MQYSEEEVQSKLSRPSVSPLMSLEIHYFSGLMCGDSSLSSSSKLVEVDRFIKKKPARRPCLDSVQMLELVE